MGWSFKVLQCNLAEIVVHLLNAKVLDKQLLKLNSGCWSLAAFLPQVLLPHPWLKEERSHVVALTGMERNPWFWAAGYR